MTTSPLGAFKIWMKRKTSTQIVAAARYRMLLGSAMVKLEYVETAQDQCPSQRDDMALSDKFHWLHNIA
jgi:hypothetical protein